MIIIIINMKLINELIIYTHQISLAPLICCIGYGQSSTSNGSMHSGHLYTRTVIHGIVSREGFQRKNVLDHSVAWWRGQVQFLLSMM